MQTGANSAAITVAKRASSARSDRECLDHVIVANAAGLHRLLAPSKDTPCPRPVTPPSAGRIVAIPEVGGLHHRFDRIAA